MAHTRCTEFDPARRTRLLAVARTALTFGCETGPLPDDHEVLQRALADAVLNEQRNCFVTLLRDGALRGCIGSLAPSRALARDVATNAYNAGFRDPRFPPVAAPELPAIDIQIAVLSPQRSLPVDSEPDLLAALEPGIDGLTLEDGAHKATFLPKVWEHLDDRRGFVRELKRKAGLPGEYWSPTIRFWRYHAENFAESGIGTTG